MNVKYAPLTFYGTQTDIGSHFEELNASIPTLQDLSLSTWYCFTHSTPCVRNTFAHTSISPAADTFFDLVITRSCKTESESVTSGAIILCEPHLVSISPLRARAVRNASSLAHLQFGRPACEHPALDVVILSKPEGRINMTIRLVQVTNQAARQGGEG